MLEHEAAEITEGETGVEDVFDDDDVLALDGVVDVLDELDGAGGDAGATVGGDGDEVEGVIDADGAGEIGEEDGRAFEDSDEHDGLALVVGGDLGADFTSAIGDLLPGEEDLHVGGGGKGELRGSGRHEEEGSANGGWRGSRTCLGDLILERARIMYPYIHIGSFQLGTFGLMLWLAAVVATVVLHKNFSRHGVDADALNVVALVVIAGVIGAKVWHELQDVAELRAAMRQIGAARMGTSDRCGDGVSALVPGGVCVVRRADGRDCDADAAGAGGAI